MTPAPSGGSSPAQSRRKPPVSLFCENGGEYQSSSSVFLRSAHRARRPAGIEIKLGKFSFFFLKAYSMWRAGPRRGRNYLNNEAGSALSSIPAPWRWSVGVKSLPAACALRGEFIEALRPTSAAVNKLRGAAGPHLANKIKQEPRDA